MKTLDSIPTKKLNRMSKFARTGAKVGLNYVKYYGQTIAASKGAKEQLHQNNANDIYDGLKELKGSSLKMLQMLSMEKNLIPKAYSDKFSLTQFSIPPLSAPLVRRTFQRCFNKYPEEMFDSFEADAIYAASIGQVHRAQLNGKSYAVKVQYPGVADSISSDLALVKPIAIKMFHLQKKGSEQYFKEIESKLLEETDYEHELASGESLREACALIPGLKIPKYYKHLSSRQIITMDWLEGQHLSEFVKTAPLSKRTQVGQCLWDFYMFQLHRLKTLHADPHPGNFMVSSDNELLAVDFGCIKKIPEAFYRPYFELCKDEVLREPKRYLPRLKTLEILLPSDTDEEKEFFTKMFIELIGIIARPFNGEVFDFANDAYFKTISRTSEYFTNSKAYKQFNSNRGSRHFIYMNRTLFGLYNLLNRLQVKINVRDYLVPERKVS